MWREMHLIGKSRRSIRGSDLLNVLRENRRRMKSDKNRRLCKKNEPLISRRVRD